LKIWSLSLLKNSEKTEFELIFFNVFEYLYKKFNDSKNALQVYLKIPKNLNFNILFNQKNRMSMLKKSHCTSDNLIHILEKFLIFVNFNEK